MLETELRVSNLSKTQAGLIAELEESKRLAMIDPLTRLWNRMGITSLLDREWSEAVRKGNPVTLVMADIDHFKKINDTFGHAGGDDVLRNVAKKMLEVLRHEDAVGRVGGEEFLMILNNCAPDKKFETVERIRHGIADALWILDGKPYPVTMSFGVASAMPAGSDPADLIKCADDALYRAKNGGRNRVEVAGRSETH